MNEKQVIKLFQSITDIDERFIEEAAVSSAPLQKKPWLPWTVAACLCLLMAGTYLHWQTQRLLPSQLSPATVSQEDAVHKEEYLTISEDGSITIPLPRVELSSDTLADMVAFFIYQGRYYQKYEELLFDQSGLVGQYLGTAIGLIDEWTPKDGYVELAGSVTGDFYSVNGYDPAFMLCMKESDDSLAIYICNNGITLHYGRELYEDRLHLKENYQAVQYESRASWYYGRQDVHTLAEPENDAVVAFLDALNQAAFLPDSAICFQDAETPLYDFSAESEFWHVYFQMTDGTCVQLRLHEGGYVRFEGILDVCVRVPADIFEDFCDLLVSDSQS